MAVHGDFVPGCTYLTCTFCGRRRLFPDELNIGDDRKFRCRDACDEKTILSIDREIAASHYRREGPPLGFGFASQFEHEATFMEKVTDRLQIVQPGWTPTTTFYDDFTIVPGGVGSSWTVTLAGTGTVTAPSVGVARFTSGTSQARAHVATVAVPNPSAGNFYCACSFKTPSVSSDGSPAALIGAATSAAASRSALGVRSNATAQPFYHLLTSVFTRIPVEVEMSNYHLGEIWWKTGGAVFCSIDGCASISAPTSASGSRLPFIQAINASVTLDVTDYYCAV
jgi:hypothetical protein